MHQQLEQEGRIEDHDWSHYTMSNVVFRPRQMGPARLRAGQRETYGRFYSLPSIFARSITGRSGIVTRLLANFSYRRHQVGKSMCKGLPSHIPVAGPVGPVAEAQYPAGVKLETMAAERMASD